MRKILKRSITAFALQEEYRCLWFVEWLDINQEQVLMDGGAQAIGPPSMCQCMPVHAQMDGRPIACPQFWGSSRTELICHHTYAAKRTRKRRLVVGVTQDCITFMRKKINVDPFKDEELFLSIVNVGKTCVTLTTK